MMCSFNYHDHDAFQGLKLSRNLFFNFVFLNIFFILVFWGVSECSSVPGFRRRQALQNST